LPLTVTCDGSTSEDDFGHITGYAWDLGDGQTAAGDRVVHTYSRAGTYMVRLTVSNDAGLSATDCQTVTVWEQYARVQALTWSLEAGHVTLSWGVTAPCDEIRIFRGKVPVARLSGDTRTYTAPEENPGIFRYTVALHTAGTLEDQKAVIVDQGTLAWDPVLSVPVTGYYVYVAEASEPIRSTPDARLDVLTTATVPLRLLHAEGFLPRTAEYIFAVSSYRDEAVSELSSVVSSSYEVVLDSP
jgi:PKD repeat protein